MPAQGGGGVGGFDCDLKEPQRLGAQGRDVMCHAPLCQGGPGG